jgi:hypothetical protein
MRNGAENLPHTCIPTESIEGAIPSLRIVVISGLRGMDSGMPTQP